MAFRLGAGFLAVLLAITLAPGQTAGSSSSLKQTTLIPPDPFSGGIVAHGVGLFNGGPSPIVIGDLPDGATVRLALLYWAGPGATVPTPTLAGKQVSGTAIGSTDVASAFRADVTRAVRGNGSYMLDVPAGGVYGASLLIVYQAPGAPPVSVAIADGLSSSRSNADSLPVQVAFPASQFSTGTSAFVLGLGDADRVCALSLTAGGAPVSVPSGCQGTDGPNWDTQTMQPPFVAGAAAAQAVLKYSTPAGAPIAWVAFALAAPQNAAAPAPPAAGPSASPPPASAGCQLVPGFAALRSAISAEVGECLDNQAFAPNGNAEQRTTKGLLVWRKADNWTAFTNGYQTWVNGPNGIQKRLNTECFPFETCPR